MAEALRRDTPPQAVSASEMLGGGRPGAAHPLRTVLVVEDDRELRTLMVLLVAATGARVSAAPDGGRGLTLFRQLRPDLVITDIGLPQLDGLALCRRIRAEEGGRPTPIIIFSGRERDPEIARVLALGGITFVEKRHSVAGVLRAVGAEAATSAPAPRAFPPLELQASAGWSR